MNPRFSIIIPVYNVAPYLRECLDSVLAQTFTDWEAVCVDDGSTDGSGAILDEYVAKDGRFRVIHQENTGASAARNVALDVVQGEWIWFVDGDDIIDRRSLEALFVAIANFLDRPLHAVFFECRVFKGGDAPADSTGEVHDATYHRAIGASLARKFFRPASRTLLRRTAIGPLRFKGYRQNEDALFMMEYLCRGRGWVTTNAFLYFYRLREGSASHNNTYTAAMVERIFDSENELLSAALRLRDINYGCDLTGLFADLHTRSYYTYCHWYFGLTVKERRQLLPKWIAQQRRFIGLYQWPLARRIRFTAVRVFRSGYLVKPLVVGSAPGFAYLKRMFVAKSVNDVKSVS